MAFEGARCVAVGVGVVVVVVVVAGSGSTKSGCFSKGLYILTLGLFEMIRGPSVGLLISYAISIGIPANGSVEWVTGFSSLPRAGA